MAAKKSGRRPTAAAARKTPFARWSKMFLSELAATSNVSAAARKAGISPSTAYDLRRQNPEFYRQWQDALCEGYDHLEMDLLHRLRTGELKPPKDAKRATRTFDNATAFRQLALHRQTVAQGRAMRENEDAEAILAAIDAKLDKMRERALKQSAERSNDQE